MPPGYAETERRYPVLYMQDGQNLFDPATAYFGQEWRADITADHMIARGEIEPPIIVGIYNTGVRRMSEYAPTRDQRHRKGGKADRYAEMIAREIKPFIDHAYRTLKPAKYCAVGGSSLGGLASLVAGLMYPRVFGGLAVWVQLYTEKARPRMWVDIGTAEGSGAQVVDDTRALRDALLAKGWISGDDLSYHEIAGADHSERAWAARFGAVLAYLFPPRR